jgi:hypothetical protein
LIVGDGLTSGDGLGNGFDNGWLVGGGDGEDDGAGALAAAIAGPPSAPAAAATSAVIQAAAMPAAFVNDQAFLVVFLAMRDFCRAALFLWMMPRAAALSSADDAVFTVAVSASSAPAFLTSVFNFDFAERLRLRRFSEARVHLIAALILGTKYSLIDVAKIHEIIPYFRVPKQGDARYPGEIRVKRGTQASS